MDKPNPFIQGDESVAKRLKAGETFYLTTDGSIVVECPKCKAAREQAQAELDAGGSPPSLPVKCPHKW